MTPGRVGSVGSRRVGPLLALLVYLVEEGNEGPQLGVGSRAHQLPALVMTTSAQLEPSAFMVFITNY